MDVFKKWGRAIYSFKRCMGLQMRLKSGAEL